MYAGFMETLDHYVGEVLQALNDCGLRENTAVMLLSDNGRLRGSKWNLYEGGIREGDLKLLYFYEKQTSELYDLSEDTGETYDLSHYRPGQTTQLENELMEQLRSVHSRFPRRNPAYYSDDSKGKETQ